MRLAAGVCVFVLASCAAAAEQRDWAFVQSVGGMALGTPYRTAAGVMLPVRVNVSGTERITTEPRALNSGLAVKVDACRDADSDAVALRMTTLIAGPGRRASSGDVPLGNLAPGRHAIVFVEPKGGRVPVGEIVVP